MTFEVRFQPIAEMDLEEAYYWAAQHAPTTAARWLDRFQVAIRSLSERPERCAVAPESHRLKRELRQFLFGRKPRVFRVLFTIDGAVVRVVRIRRASRRMLTSKELEA